MAKRAFDLAAVLLSAPIWLPVMAAVSLAVMLALGRPVMFVQRRPGLHGRLFPMLKFRSMADVRDASGNPLPDAARLGRFGRLLRATSFDELPGLLNVLAGQMSLVGPRPLLPDYLPLYSAYETRRHEVRPGITGWAQVNGRNAITWEEKFAADVWYVDHRSMALDLKILLLTVKRVLLARNIAAAGEATMPRFTGCHRETGSEGEPRI